MFFYSLIIFFNYVDDNKHEGYFDSMRIGLETVMVSNYKESYTCLRDPPQPCFILEQSYSTATIPALQMNNLSHPITNNTVLLDDNRTELIDNSCNALITDNANPTAENQDENGKSKEL